ncbi:hypothetical protein JCM3775_003601 [Rhodotorula graminis]
MVSIKHLLEKRRGIGGGGGGRGGGGSSSGGRSSGGSSSSGSSTRSGTSSSSGPPGYSPSPFGYGGGAPRTVSGGVPFSGRQFGGATRGSIYSGRGYGGGYGNYARGAALGGVAGVGFGYVGGLGFPYGYWPLYYGHGYYGDDEYGPYRNDSRPGGPLAAASFSPSQLDASVPPQYMVYGDSASVGNVTQALQDDCGAVLVVDSTPVMDDGTFPSSTNSTLLPRLDPSNVLTYYRASSFALYSFFDGQEADPAATVNYTESVSQAPYQYPADTRDVNFESCVNQTIQQTLPVEEGYTSAAFGGAEARRGQVLAAAALAVLLVNGVQWQVALIVVLAVATTASMA